MGPHLLSPGYPVLHHHVHILSTSKLEQPHNWDHLDWSQTWSQLWGSLYGQTWSQLWGSLYGQRTNFLYVKFTVCHICHERELGDNRKWWTVYHPTLAVYTIKVYSLSRVDKSSVLCVVCPLWRSPTTMVSVCSHRRYCWGSVCTVCGTAC